jgi:FeS assembly protein IscX
MPQSIEGLLDRPARSMSRSSSQVLNLAGRAQSGGLMPEINWTDTEEIAIRLVETHPDVDPLTVRFTDLHRWVMELEGFAGDAKGSNEKKLEAIQMAWHEEWQDKD